MSEIYGSEVSGSEVSSSSGEVRDDSSTRSSGEVNTGETSEVEDTPEVTENEVDDDFSSELDDLYLTYMEDEKINAFDKEESDEVRESEEMSELDETGEADESFEQELDGKYADYLNGEHTSEELQENSRGMDAVEDTKEDSDDINSELDKKYNEYIDEGGKQGELSDTDRAELKEETGWSDEVVDSIDTFEQAEIYKNADLHEDNINGRECLVKEIDYDYVDEKTGMTNRERMAKGRSPYDAKTGEKIELHHMGQEYDAPFAELTENSEHGDGNHSILHPRTEDSWRNDKTLEAQYSKEKREHWKTKSRE